MVTMDEARRIALSRMSDKGWFDFCTEFENAFVFSRHDDISIGGNGSCAVMKATGEACTFAGVLAEIGDEVRGYKMALDGTFTEVPLESFESE